MTYIRDNAALSVEEHVAFIQAYKLSMKCLSLIDANSGGPA